MCHTTVQLLEELSILLNNPGKGENEQSLISKYYKEVTPLDHLIQSGNCPLAFDYTYESLFYEARVLFSEGRQIQEAEDHDKEFKKISHKKMRTCKCFTMDSSKMESEPFIGFTLGDIRNGTF
jgi:hypothetical protein